ncbi:MAG: ATP-binding cassette domain-containing protein [Deltaproteobacteria bacterium]|nr:ATP-binding cassette domain-containing protein [Deltaproteobacteria bacterium]
MAILTVNNISLTFGGYPILDNASFVVEPGEKVCLVGRNGTGKSTLLKIISGMVSKDSGDVNLQAGAKVSMLPQDVPETLNGSCLDVIIDSMEQSGLTYAEKEHAAKEVLSRVELHADFAAAALSGGQKRRLLLAGALVIEPDLLLLDEPSNHLDIDSIKWLEGFMSKFRGAILFVSHDRAFIRSLATRMLDLDRGALKSFACRYDEFLVKKEQFLQDEQKQWERFDKKLAEEEVWIRKGIQARRTRNEGRVRSLIKMRNELSERQTLTGTSKFEINVGDRTSKKVVETLDASFCYDGETDILQNLNLTLYRGEKVGIIGNNGCGKTTLLKLLLGKLMPTKGVVNIGENLQIAYLDQLRATLDEKKTVAQNLADGSDSVVVNGQVKHVISYLRDFLFSSKRANSPVWILSGGERNRLLLAKLFTKKANVLVFDEPTNDLDTETLELLEDKINSFEGTVLIVSHDREFINNTVTSSWVFEDDTVTSYAGGYDDWQKQRKPVEPVKVVKIVNDEGKRDVKRVKNSKKLSYMQARELDELPLKIETLETEQSELLKKLDDPAFFIDNADEVTNVSSRLESIEAELMDVLERWEALESLKDGKGSD